MMMNPLWSILRSSHCHNTHHLFLLDSMRLVQTNAGNRLVRLMLRHHDRMLAGALDPDVRFRDFQNHRIHVEEGYWGGAPRVAHRWYDRMQRYLRDDCYPEAAHAAGVLSHYFADVMQPLHTVTNAQEKILHLPLEHSVRCSYQYLYKAWQDNDMRVVFQLSDQPEWLGEAMLHGARYAYHQRQSLIEGYALERARWAPQHALDREGQASLAELFGLIITGLARIWERAALDAEALRRRPLPKSTLVVPAVLAAIDAPWKRVVQWYLQRRERLDVADLLDEFERTGDLKEHLPHEVDIAHRVVQVYHDEVRWKEKRRQRLASKRTVVEVETATSSADAADQPATIPFVTLTGGQGSLTGQSRLTEAPSIGPKTAARFETVGIKTVGDLLSRAPDQIASQLQTYWITAETIGQWQAQATLMCEIAHLRASHAKLLAGAGYRSASDLAGVLSVQVHRDVVRYSQTTSGRRHLRSDSPPSKSLVTRWVQQVSGESAQRRAA